MLFIPTSRTDSRVNAVSWGGNEPLKLFHDKSRYFNFAARDSSLGTEPCAQAGTVGGAQTCTPSGEKKNEGPGI